MVSSEFEVWSPSPGLFLVIWLLIRQCPWLACGEAPFCSGLLLDYYKWLSFAVASYTGAMVTHSQELAFLVFWLLIYQFFLVGACEAPVLLWCRFLSVNHCKWLRVVVLRQKMGSRSPNAHLFECDVLVSPWTTMEGVTWCCAPLVVAHNIGDCLVAEDPQGPMGVHALGRGCISSVLPSHFVAGSGPIATVQSVALIGWGKLCPQQKLQSRSHKRSGSCEYIWQCPYADAGHSIQQCCFCNAYLDGSDGLRNFKARPRHLCGKKGWSRPRLWLASWQGWERLQERAPCFRCPWPLWSWS